MRIVRWVRIVRGVRIVRVVRIVRGERIVRLVRIVRGGRIVRSCQVICGVVWAHWWDGDSPFGVEGGGGRGGVGWEVIIIIQLHLPTLVGN